MMLHKAAEWLLKSEVDGIDNHKPSKIDVTAVWCCSVGGYILTVSVNDCSPVAISSQRSERRVFKTLDGLIKCVNDVGLNRITVCK